jgi:hypothetical protein
LHKKTIKEAQLRLPGKTPREIYNMYYAPEIYISHVDDTYTRYVIDFWNSDYRLTLYGLSEVRGLLREYLLVMMGQEFRALAPSHIEFSIHNKFADELIRRLNLLLRGPHVIEHLPVSEAEVSAYFEMLLSCVQKQMGAST